MIRRPVKLRYAAALQRMFKGAQLIRTNSNKRVEFEVSPGGNPVALTIATRVSAGWWCRSFRSLAARRATVLPSLIRPSQPT
jgi:hypothetical protein